MKYDMTAYCGLDCSKCGAYLAKKNDDADLRREIAEKWTTPDYSVKPEEVACDGCRTMDGVHFKHCYECKIRNCAVSRGVETCAHCDDFECSVLKQSLDQMDSYARDMLRSIRDSIS